MKFDISKLNATTTITIPAFDGIEEFEIEVRRPNLSKMIENDEIPNPLLGAASAAITGMVITQKKENIEEEAKAFIDLTNLYCTVCMVNPKYEEVKEYLTDDQKVAITTWAMADVKTLRRFHTQQKNS